MSEVMSEGKKILLGGVVAVVTTILISTYSDYKRLKEIEVVTLEREAVKDLYVKLDSLYKIEQDYREDYKKQIKKTMDSVAGLSSANSQITRKVLQIVDKEFIISSMERDSIYKTMK